MKKLFILSIFCFLLTGCGSGGVSQAEYDKVVAERDRYKELYEFDSEQYDYDKVEDAVSQEMEQSEVKEEKDSETEATLSEELGVTVYEEGQYKVGVDIPSGEYMVVSNSGGGYFSVTTDANGEDIIFNDNFDCNSIITIKDGEFLDLSRCLAIQFDEFYNAGYEIDMSNQGTMTKIGYEIQPGEYKVIGEDGYFCIYSDSRQQDIISNDNFNGSSYINVEQGQYLVLNGCVIEQSE